MPTWTSISTVAQSLDELQISYLKAEIYAEIAK